MLVVRLIFKKKTHSNYKIDRLHLEIHCGGGPYLANYKQRLSEYEDGGLITTKFHTFHDHMTAPVFEIQPPETRRWHL